MRTFSPFDKKLFFVCVGVGGGGGGGVGGWVGGRG